jgi:membrane-associated phospholipid phosphatase
VYVGVHYPLDVLGGIVLGLAVGTVTARVFHHYWGTVNLDNILH